MAVGHIHYRYFFSSLKFQNCFLEVNRKILGKSSIAKVIFVFFLFRGMTVNRERVPGVLLSQMAIFAAPGAVKDTPFQLLRRVISLDECSGNVSSPQDVQHLRNPPGEPVTHSKAGNASVSQPRASWGFPISCLFSCLRAG